MSSRPQAQQKPFVALAQSSPLTEERGQDCVSCGLHLKATAPEEALVVESESQRWHADGFH